MTEEPKASSTPKFFHVKGRPPIGSLDKDFLQSPINLHSELYEGEFSNSDSNDDDDTDDISKELSTNTTFCNCISPVFATLMGIAILIIFTSRISLHGEEVTTEKPSITELRDQFPSQTKDFWLTVEVNIEEILNSNQPKTLLFLYDEDSQRTMEDVVYKIAKYATCTLTNCSSVPVHLNGQELNTPDILNDYGKIIASVKTKLEENGVLIVKNLEAVSGASAQAFHSLCDEYNPLVKKALFIFTLKADGFDKNNIDYVENYLRDRWSDITGDLFYPLYTRISYNILPIMAELRTTDL